MRIKEPVATVTINSKINDDHERENRRVSQALQSIVNVASSLTLIFYNVCLKMRWRPTNLHASVYPMRIYLAVVGFDVFEYPIGRPHLSFSVIYTIIFTSFSCAAFVLTVKHSFESSWFQREEKIFYVILYVNFVVAGLGQILSWYYRKRRLSCINRTMKIDETLQQLGVTLNYSVTMNYAIAAIFFNVVGVFLNMFHVYFWFPKSIPTGELIIVITILYFPTSTNYMTTLGFCILMRIIDMRCGKANNVLERTFKPVSRPPLKHYPRRLLPNKVHDESNFIIPDRESLQITEKRISTIQIIRHVHLELAQITLDLDRSFSAQMLFEMAANFVFFTSLLYTTYTVIVNPSVDRRWERLIVMCSFGTMFILKLLLINHIAHRVAVEAKRTGNLIHSIEDSSMNSDLADEIRQFSLHLTHHCLCFSPAGFFTLGYGFLRAFFGTVVTYLMILIQMGPTTAKS